jgi:hypothetical protein
MQLNDEQKKVLHSVIENPQGLHISQAHLVATKLFL